MTVLKRTMCIIRCRPLLSALAAVTVLCLISALFVDRPLAQYYRGNADPETLAAFHYITDLGDATGYVIAIVLTMGASAVVGMFGLYESTFEWLARIVRAGQFILLSLAFSGVALHAIKFTLGRFRPRALFESNVYDISVFTAGYLNNSFPSGHSQVMGALAAALIIVYPRYDLLYLLVAALVGYSRIVTGDHFLSDVVFGLFLGAASAILVKRWLFDRRGLPLRIILSRDRALAASDPPSFRTPTRP